MRVLRASLYLSAAILAACASSPFKPETGDSTRDRPTQTPGEGPAVATPPVITGPTPEAEPSVEVPMPLPPPRDRPRAAPATLSPASKALVTQAQGQRKRGDLPGAAVSLDRALRIEPNNPLLWIELGRLRMDQGNFPQAEGMGRKALAMSIGDDGTQSQAWQLIGESYRARGRNTQAEEALARARELAPL
jgi:tetratricopeptide (TPR) repeat protein